MAKYTNKDVFTLSSISVILCECFYNIVCIFVDTFFISRILSITGYSLYYLGMFYFVLYAVRIFLGLGLNYLIRKIKLNYFVTIGSVIMIALVLSVYFLGDAELISYLPLLAAVYCMGSAFFWTGHNNLATIAVSSRYQVRFFTVKRTSVTAVKAIAPFLLGSAISGAGEAGFKIVAILMSVFTILLFVFSLFIKQNKKFTMTFKFFPYVKRMISDKAGDYKLLKNMYTVGFLCGFGITMFTVLFTFMVFKYFKSDFSLGIVKTCITAVSLVGMFIFLKYYRKRHAKWYTLVPMVLIPISGAVMLAFTNQITIIIFFVFYNVLTVNVSSLIEMRRAGVIRLLSMHEHILEHNALYEFVLDFSRIIGFALYMIVGVLDSEVAFIIMVAVFLVLLAFLCYSVYRTEKLLVEQDKEWKKSHIAVSDDTKPIEVQQKGVQEAK